MSKEDQFSAVGRTDTDAASTAADVAVEPSASHAKLRDTKRMDNAREISGSRILPDPEQPRKTFEQGPLEELAVSISEHGVLHPITVEYIEAEDYYKIISGERRWKASKIAGLETVPCVVHNGVADVDRFARQIVENLQREDLSPIEKATSLVDYKQRIGENIPWEEVEKRTGLGKRRRQQFTALLNLPEAMQREIVETGRRPARNQITEKHARALLLLNKIPEKQHELFNRIKTSNAPITGDVAIKEAKRMKGETALLRFSVTYTDEKELLGILKEKIEELKNSINAEQGET